MIEMSVLLVIGSIVQPLLKVLFYSLIQILF